MESRFHRGSLFGSKVFDRATYAPSLPSPHPTAPAYIELNFKKYQNVLSGHKDNNNNKPPCNERWIAHIQASNEW